MALSRMAGLLLVVLAQSGNAQPLVMPNADALLATYQTRTAAEPHCRKAQGEEIIVCGRRQADRYRVPFITRAPGDPQGESVMGERERIAADHPDKCGIGAILAHCGMAGVHLSADFSRDPIKMRPLAP